jgi:hypothetical protein
VGKQKTYGRFLGMIFWEEGQSVHPPQGKAVTAAKTVKNRKTTKKSSFFFRQNPRGLGSAVVPTALAGVSPASLLRISFS